MNQPSFNPAVELPAKIENWFTYHAPTPEQLVQYHNIREAGKAFALVVAANTPSSADQTASIRLIREATMTANGAIACGGK